MGTPHKCPVCNGTGKVSTPPHIAGDVEVYGSSNGYTWQCNACKGSGIVWEWDAVNIPSVFGLDDALTMKAEITTTKHNDWRYVYIDYAKQQLHRMG